MEGKKQKKEKIIEEKIEIPGGVEVSIDSALYIKGQKGELKKIFNVKNIRILKDGNSIIVRAEKTTKRERKLLYTIVGHIKNMIKGVTEGFIYKLQICSVHFPMNVKYSKEESAVIIDNFIGEKKPRKAFVLPNVSVKIDGDAVTVESIDKEAAGQTAANIETATKIKNKDRRVFQDGIWITSKAGKGMEE